MAPTYSGTSVWESLPSRSRDGPRGVSSGRATSFPVAIARAATWDLDLQRRVGEAIGQEVRAQGANCWGGLCLNICAIRPWDAPRRPTARTPGSTGEMGVAILEAVQRHNVMACAKHFALNSMETARFKVDVAIDERTLHEVYLPHFRKAVEHDVATVMSAYNKVRGECAARTATCSPGSCATSGVRGLLTSDWMYGLYDGRRRARRARHRDAEGDGSTART